MADSKVSALAAVTTYSSSDLVYLVASSASKKITVANFLANAPAFTFANTIGFGTINAVNAAVSFSYNNAHLGQFWIRTLVGGPFSGTYDPLIVYGYNCVGSGVRVEASEPAFYHSIEADYNNGTVRVIEENWEYVHTDGTIFRVLAFTTSRTTVGGWTSWVYYIGNSGSNNFFRILNYASTMFFEISVAGQMYLPVVNTHLFGTGSANVGAILTLGGGGYNGLCMNDSVNSAGVLIDALGGGTSAVRFASYAPASATLPFTFNDSVTITQATLGGLVHRLVSTASNDDAAENVYQGKVTTTDGTVTTLLSLALLDNQNYVAEAVVCVHRTGGVSGATNDGGGYVVRAVVKCTTSTAALIGSATTTTIGESTAGFDATIDTTGATLRVRVTGAATTNLAWTCTLRIWAVGT